MLVGFDVELKVEFASGIREEVHKLYRDVKKTGGSLSILGYQVSARAAPTERVNTEFNGVKWDKANGSMSLTPTKGQVYPTILGVVAQRFD
jgi:hypothetical protein